MTFKDLIQFSYRNLLQSKLRSGLTVLGVAIGTGALVAMMSYGTGLQKTFTDEFSDLEFFSSVRVTTTRVDLSSLLSFSKRTVRNKKDKTPDKNSIVLTDSVLTIVREAAQSISPNAIVYPEILFPAKIAIDTMETIVMAEALPSVMKDVAGWKEIHYGKFFENDSTNEVVISEILLNRLGLQNPQDAIGKEIRMTTVSLDAQKLLNFASSPLSFMGGLPISEKNYRFRIGGILSQDIQKLSSGFRVIVPLESSKKINRLNFLSSIDLLRQSQAKDGYQAITVRATNQKEAELMKVTFENMGLNAVSFSDQFEEFKKLFLIFDLALAVVGTIALIVATLGITNTMIMSIMERYREIGIMKAIGASDRDIRKIFCIESAIIGLIGGVIGVVLGWLVTKGINALANIYVVSQAGTNLNFFYFPIWMVFGAVVFSILISLLAGLYPANRAARIEPAEALRYQ